jgi:hypothetical protein
MKIRNKMKFEIGFPSPPQDGCPKWKNRFAEGGRNNSQIPNSNWGVFRVPMAFEETVKTVDTTSVLINTPLKQGVNEKALASAMGSRVVSNLGIWNCFEFRVSSFEFE